MKIILKSAVVVDPKSKYHLKKRDLLIHNGKITKIASKIEDPKAQTIKLQNLHISRGWFDSSVCFGEPGFEERETLENGLKVAALSGFTDVAVNSNTQPVVDSKSAVQFLLSKVHDPVTQVHPVGALTTQSEGENLAELYDMQNEGAVSFYDYQKPIKNPNLLKIALQYAQGFDALVQSFPLEASLANKGVVNEGATSTALGLKGIPSLSEELQISRDLYLLEYAGGSLHIPTISSEKSVQLIKDAKKKGLDVSCSVAIHNLVLTDSVLEEFDTYYKLLPPLRSEKDRKTLIKGLKEGTIDGVTSNHNPIDVEHKRTEFDQALFGSIGLEGCFETLLNATDLETTIKALTHLKERFKIDDTNIAEGETACLTLFNPSPSGILEDKHLLSTSKNAALLNQATQGVVYGIINNSKIMLHE